MTYIPSMPENSEESIKLLHWFEDHNCSNYKAARICGVHEKTVRRWKARAHKILKGSKPISSGEIKPFTHKSKRLSGKRYLFTSAQNNTDIHEDFYKSLLNFCKHKNAELIIGKFTYNQNGFQNLTKEDDGLWYHPDVLKHDRSERLTICDDLEWCGEANILPTAVNPLSGYDGYTKQSSGIFPHTKIMMKSLATLKHEDAKMLYTTGTITKRNYIAKKAGQKADFDHCFGALYVEIDSDGDWFARQIRADDDGSFYDLTELFAPDGVSGGHEVEAINWGDIHVEKLDGVISEGAWYGKDSMLNTLKPRHQFLHDVSDFEPRNHHNINDPHFLARQHFNGINNVESALKLVSNFIKSVERPYCKTVIVDSNHDAALLKWLSTACVKRDPENARFYHEASAEVYKAIENNEKFNVFEWVLKRHNDLDNAIFLETDEIYRICGNIECSQHGHRGANGARGNPRSYVGYKANTGHTHSAGIISGVYTAGVSGSLDMGYNQGMSAWSHSHILTYKNGKRAIITMRKGKWHA